jgi:hypothetical protein
MNIVVALNIPPSEVRKMTGRELFALNKIMKGRN